MRFSRGHSILVKPTWLLMALVWWLLDTNNQESIQTVFATGIVIFKLASQSPERASLMESRFLLFFAQRRASGVLYSLPGVLSAAIYIST